MCVPNTDQYNMIMGDIAIEFNLIPFLFGEQVKPVLLIKNTKLWMAVGPMGLGIYMAISSKIFC